MANSSKNTLKWQELARQMGLTWHEGLEDFFASPERRRIIAREYGSKGIEKLETLIKNPLFQTITQKMGFFAMDGHYQDFFVTIFPMPNQNASENNTKQNHANIAFFFRQPLGMDLIIEKARIHHKIARFFGSKKYIAIPGQKQFSTKWTVQASNKSQAEVTLSDAKTAAEIAAVFAYSSKLKKKSMSNAIIDTIIEDYGIRTKFSSDDPDKATIEHILDSQIPLIRRLS